MASFNLTTLPQVFTEANVTPQDNDVQLWATPGLIEPPVNLGFRDFKSKKTIKVLVTVGSVQFSVTGLVTADNPLMTNAMGIIELQVEEGVTTLNWKTAAQNDAFIIFT